jgi:PIN domain nuclease of toxin-antitoxin system
LQLLLDTHALVWFVAGSARLPEAVLREIQSLRNVVFVSPISAYEIALKFNRGLWPETAKIARDFDAVCDRAGFIPLPIKAAHATAAGAFALEHRDPFDRILAAQAMIEDMSIVSIDAKLDIFRTKRVWA